MKKLLLLLVAFFTVVSLMAQYAVTFSVDISDATGFNPDSTDVYISADFFGWPMPGTNPVLIMTVTADPDVYEFTCMLPEGENIIQYKYFFVYNGIPSWDYGEWNGDPNRHVVFNRAKTINNIWANQPKYVRFMVSMDGVIFDPDTTDIYISGTFADSAQPGTVDYWKMEVSLLETYEISRWIYSGEQQYKYYMVNYGIPSWEHGEWEGEPYRIANIVNDTAILDYWGLIAHVKNIPEASIGNIYPNPTKGKVNILFDIVPDPYATLQILDINGKLIRRIHISNELIQFDMSSESSGIYILHLQTNKFIITQKLLKQ